MNRALQTITMLLVCGVCLALLAPGYAIVGMVALVFVLGIWALIEDHGRRER